MEKIGLNSELYIGDSDIQLKDIICLDKYSTDEIKTNKVWINNKPIYRKVMSLTLNANSNIELDVSILNYDFIWINQDSTFSRYGGSQTSSSAIYYVNETDNGIVYVNANKKLIIKNNSVNTRIYYITLEFTKL